ncbi:hypothetical protein FCV55_14340 [Vibrio sp. F13]|uniref:hypothetical protein n=1 Tax=Vibrio sp. F13 TaxID=2070777 RepID=UPI0010BDCE13|nr:hypothetical protein [Vibrio sp. F13]TKF68189.1 hypothetical protein FCV55_14340 [Vibrio sp. F13]
MSQLSEQEIELSRQLDEAKKIGSMLRTLAVDMCHSRRVNYDFASNELITNAFLMSKKYHNNVHQDMIKQHGPQGFRDFESVFCDIAIKKIIASGQRLSDGNNPSTFGILTGDDLSNENLAQSLFLLKNYSIESVTDKGFYIGREGEFYKIRVSVYQDFISFFDYQDEPDQDLDSISLACARYNSKSKYSKAHVVNSDGFQTHFEYLLPHSGSVFVKDISNVINAFINEQMEFVSGA